MAISSNSNFCIRPFNSVVISTDGAIRSCCQIQENTFNIKNNNIEDYWNSNYLLTLREKFLNNKKPKECKNCWRQENNLLESHRLESNFQYKSIFKKNYVKNLKLIKKDNLYYPEDIELSITNICNLSCQMCTGKDSSRLLIENNFLKFENLKQSDYDLDEKTKLEIEKIITHDLKLLNLRGGEPLVNKTIMKIIEKLVTTGKSKKMTLHITTNGTTCNDKIINLLRKFENIRIMFSIESIGKFNDYMRYPSNWKDIQKNILEFKNLKNAYLYINTVVQNLNLLYLEPLINFANLNKIFLNFSRLRSPAYLEFDNLPLDLLKKSYEKLNNIDKKKLVHTKNIKEIINSLKIKIDTYKHDEEKFTMFTTVIKKRDQYRKISIADYMPEIYNIL
jgi:radical SAM protein with 4Fe4S-binding SPASM domain